MKNKAVSALITFEEIVIVMIIIVILIWSLAPINHWLNVNYLLYRCVIFLLWNREFISMWEVFCFPCETNLPPCVIIEPRVLFNALKIVLYKWPCAVLTCLHSKWATKILPWTNRNAPLIQILRALEMYGRQWRELILRSKAGKG